MVAEFLFKHDNFLCQALKLGWDVSLKRRRKRNLLWGVRGEHGRRAGREERFGQRGGMAMRDCWDGERRGNTQEQYSTSNKASRSHVLEVLLFQKKGLVLLAACSCDLHVASSKSTSGFSWTGTIQRRPAKTIFADTPRSCWLSSHERTGLARLQSHPFHAHCSQSDRTIVCRAWTAKLRAWNWIKVPHSMRWAASIWGWAASDIVGVGDCHWVCAYLWSCWRSCSCHLSGSLHYRTVGCC